MQKVHVAVLISGLLAMGCTNSHPRPDVQMTPRDTSISPENAFTHLSLDSTAVLQFISANVHDSATARSMIDFYNTRNYQFAWFNEDGLSEQADAFWSTHQGEIINSMDSLPFSKGLHREIDSILTTDLAAASQAGLQNVELGLTFHFIQYINIANSGKIDPVEMKWLIPARKIDPLAALDTFLTTRNKDWRPLAESYYRLKDKLDIYAAIAKAGGWPNLEIKEKVLKIGARSEEITKIKQRLRLTGELVATDSGTAYDKPLETAVRKAQLAYGLPVNGSIDKTLINQLNIPATDRVKQIIINLERMKWMPVEDSIYILANIPEYSLELCDQDTIRLQMKIVVGRAANNTVIFSDRLKYIVFSPYWNVPASIVRNEIAPAIKKDRGYLKRNNMEITGFSNGLPVIRQKPGNDNALGKVKFIFPNRFNIYFHDTPAKELFKKQERAFSHGCIRLQKPFLLAKRLLADSPGWNGKTIREAMNGHKEVWVPLPKAIPVYIVYFTSWVDDAGLLHFAKDIYGHDKKMAGHLFKKTSR